MLAEKAREERLLRPGALDPAVPDNPYYARQTFSLISRYRVGHDWPNLGRSCQYGGSYSGKPADIGLKLFDSLGEIYEEDGKTYYKTDKSYASLNPKTRTSWRSDLDRFVRPTYKRQIPEFDSASKKTGRMVEQEQPGFTPICFEAWVGTGHSLAVRLHKSPMDERTGFYSKRPGEHSQEMIGGQVWWVWRYPIGDGHKTYGGEAWVRPIGNTDYTIAIELGVGPESLRHPYAHAKFKAMYRHLIESVRIEPLTPQIEAEQEALKRRAHELAREDCKQRERRKVLDPWCRQLLQQP